MNKRKYILVILLFVSMLTQAQGSFDIEVKNLDGQYTTISELSEGDLIVLDFWATWCKPCIKSIPKLVALSEKYESTQVNFIGVNTDSPRNMNKVKPLAISLGISYPTLMDTDQEIMNELLVNAFPTLIILDKKGKVLFTHEGYISGDEALIEEEINKLLSTHE